MMRSGNRVLVLAGLTLLAAMSACGREEAETPAAIPSVSGELQAAPAAAVSQSVSNTIKVYKDPNCGCCNNWVDHLRKHGFTVETMDMPDLSLLKQKYAISPELQSCHTAVVGNYAIEGHVPADIIAKLLKEKPAIAGLAVPGMPIGSPGMEGAVSERYDILAFDRTGRTTVYAQR